VPEGVKPSLIVPSGAPSDVVDARVLLEASPDGTQCVALAVTTWQMVIAAGTD